MRRFLIAVATGLAVLASRSALADGPLPGPGGGGSSGGGSTITLTLRTIVAGNVDTASVTDSTIVWASATASAKTQSLFSCSLSQRGHIITIKDGAASAGTYQITVTPFGADTIDGASSLVMVFNAESEPLTCNGGGVWERL